MCRVGGWRVAFAHPTNGSPRTAPGQRPSAGWASNSGSRHFMVQHPSTELLGGTVAKAPARGGGRALPGGAKAP